jgi:hypothetical protein
MRYIGLLLIALVPVPALSASLVGSWTCPNSDPHKTVHYKFSAGGRFVLSAASQPSGIPGAYDYSGNKLCLSYGGTKCVTGASGTDTVTIQWLSATSFRVKDPQGPSTVCKRDP